MTDTGAVSVYRIMPGSLLVLRDVVLPPRGDDESGMGQVVTEMIRATGHDRFVILSITGDSHAELIGPQELRDRLRQAVASADAGEPGGTA